MQRPDFDTGEIGDCIEHSAVGAGMLWIGVGMDDEDHSHEYRRESTYSGHAGFAPLLSIPHPFAHAVGALIGWSSLHATACARVYLRLILPRFLPHPHPNPPLEGEGINTRLPYGYFAMTRFGRGQRSPAPQRWENSCCRPLPTQLTN